jgi:hypothetical protein
VGWKCNVTFFAGGMQVDGFEEVVHCLWTFFGGDSSCLHVGVVVWRCLDVGDSVGLRGGQCFCGCDFRRHLLTVVRGASCFYLNHFCLMRIITTNAEHCFFEIELY